MTALETTVAPLVESPALIPSTVSPASTLPPGIVCAIGFIWVAELAACKPDKDRLQLRTKLIECPVGYHYRVKYDQCIQMKYHPKQITGKIGKWFKFNETTTWKPPTKHYPKTTAYTGRWYAYGMDLMTTMHD